MAKYNVLYNPLAGNGKGENAAKKLKELLNGDELTFTDMTKVSDYRALFASMPEDERVIVSGGDGTLNRFINDTEEVAFANPVYYYATGSGNDFLKDIGGNVGDKPVCIDKYLKALPTVDVKGKSYRFINGIGYGIDGYCCEVGDKLRETSDKPINYAGIAIKGLLFHYHPTSATVIVDGVEHKYKKVWLAPTMNGRYYGGGMIPTPKQDRLNKEHTVSVMVYYGSGKIKSLAVFPSIFKGEHVNHREMVEVLSGKEITVRFDSPAALQVDGETIIGVTEYSVRTGKAAEKLNPAEAFVCA
ncbi:MAG: diacylglycerol kinase family protein [Ruminococcus sp.]|nr:diacylglycerol kinase family protein [Ruminococcus sp.]MDD7670564.1 diacylglycerol kinase family protein [Ruminococcus sp.]MDY2743329.1 diacylglycerol kinase family protein [Eubacteriales bacterium]